MSKNTEESFARIMRSIPKDVREEMGRLYHQDEVKTYCPDCLRESKLGIDIREKGFCTYVNCDWQDYEMWPIGGEDEQDN